MTPAGRPGAVTRVKVCGITSEADRAAAAAAGADALGFVVDVTVDTERELSPGRAAALIEDAPPFVTTVLVTMPTDADHALELVSATGADAVQIHSDLPVEDVEAVADETSARIVKAIDADRDAARRYAPAVDALLVDSRADDGAGGTGRRTDWGTASAIREMADRPVVLAGGLDPGNVADAVDAVRPYGVDVSSGVEAREGRKDHEAVRAFVEAAKRRPITP